MDFTPLVLSSMNALATMIAVMMFVTGPLASLADLLARVTARG